MGEGLYQPVEVLMIFLLAVLMIGLSIFFIRRALKKQRRHNQAPTTGAHTQNCPRCGTYVPISASFCTKCGEQLSVSLAQVGVHQGS